MKYSAQDLADVGFQYLGVPYDKMDCQRFVETCMKDVGYYRDLPGSNAWYRAMDWKGSPEECIKQFGCVPNGAILFILEQDGKEPEKYKGDGIGNASHMGIKTGRGEGAINSSHSRGCVCESKFRDKSINGGWNRVGLLDAFDYGKSVNWVMEHSESENTEDGETMHGTVTAPSGSTVNLRNKPSTSSALVDRIPIGSEAQILEEKGEWDKVVTCGRVGWMKKEFVSTEPVAEDPPDEDEDDFTEDDLPEDEAAELLARIYDQLGSLRKEIEKVIGRG